MRGIKVPDPVRELIIERIKNGERVDDIASEFDLYPNTIRKWLSKASINISDGRTKSKSSDALQISRLQREKQQLLEIIGELTVLTRESKKNLRDHLIAKKPDIPRTVICLALGINRSSSYYKHTLPNRDKPWLDKIVSVLITNPDYGIYRLKLHFDLQGENISQGKIRRICRSNGITSRRKRKYPPKRDRSTPYTGIANLIKDIEIIKPDHIWCGDFSYFRVNGIWMYLATVIDVYIKEILGYSLSTNHNSTLVCNSLNMSLRKNRRPIIFHSDQGSEYSLIEFRNILSIYKINQSNSEKSSPWQNSYQESFYGKFKDEMGLPKIQSCTSYMEVYSLITERINYYNTKRIHTTIRNIPQNFYNNWLLKEEKRVS